MTKGWFKNQSEDGVLYVNDPMSNIKGVGKGIQKLLKENDINTIADLRGLDMRTRINDIACWEDKRTESCFIKAIPDELCTCLNQQRTSGCFFH